MHTTIAVVVAIVVLILLMYDINVDKSKANRRLKPMVKKPVHLNPWEPSELYTAVDATLAKHKAMGHRAPETNMVVADLLEAYKFYYDVGAKCDRNAMLSDERKKAGKLNLQDLVEMDAEIFGKNSDIVINICNMIYGVACFNMNVRITDGKLIMP